MSRLDVELELVGVDLIKKSSQTGVILRCLAPQGGNTEKDNNLELHLVQEAGRAPPSEAPSGVPLAPNVLDLGLREKYDSLRASVS